MVRRNSNYSVVRGILTNVFFGNIRRFSYDLLLSCDSERSGNDFSFCHRSKRIRKEYLTFSRGKKIADQNLYDHRVCLNFHRFLIKIQQNVETGGFL